MTTAHIHGTAPAAQRDVEAERWWWDEVGVLVEHEVWHLPRLADEQDAMPSGRVE